MRGMTWLAIDIGGANLKVADGRGFARSVAFPLWRTPDGLAAALQALIAEAPAAIQLAVTMTGELADCYETKSQGVRRILAAVDQAADERSVSVYCTDGRFISPPEALQNPISVAAGNWHALAAFCGRILSGGSPGLLIDIGSTTADIVPIGADGPANRASTDPERLACGELVYTGMARTPVCAILDHTMWRDRRVPLARELFATAQDAYVTLDRLPEAPECIDTADGRPLTKPAARDRLARMICADRKTFTEDDAAGLAAAVQGAQIDTLAAAASRVIGAMSNSPKTVILCGQGEFLARDLIDGLIQAEALEEPIQRVSLSEQLGPQVSRAAPAHALAVLARERCEPHDAKNTAGEDRH